MPSLVPHPPHRLTHSLNPLILTLDLDSSSPKISEATLDYTHKLLSQGLLHYEFDHLPNPAPHDVFSASCLLNSLSLAVNILEETTPRRIAMNIVDCSVLVVSPWHVSSAHCSLCSLC
ncbi:hypothetical protein AAC387_Pa07g1607 [Persea americana]